MEYICLYRSILDHWVFADEKYFRAWIYILLSANHKDNKTTFDKSVIVIKRGQFITSQRKLAESWNVSLPTVHKMLDNFKNEQMIDFETNQKRTLITVVNYDVYTEQLADEQAN